jgi:hypothetical protein
MTFRPGRARRFPKRHPSGLQNRTKKVTITITDAARRIIKTLRILHRRLTLVLR